MTTARKEPRKRTEKKERVMHLYIWVDKNGVEHGDLTYCILDNPEVHADYAQGFDALGLVNISDLDGDVDT